MPFLMASIETNFDHGVCVDDPNVENNFDLDFFLEHI